jgi:hypothetical protein
MDRDRAAARSSARSASVLRFRGVTERRGARWSAALALEVRATTG